MVPIVTHDRGVLYVFKLHSQKSLALFQFSLEGRHKLFKVVLQPALAAVLRLKSLVFDSAQVILCSHSVTQKKRVAQHKIRKVTE